MQILLDTNAFLWWVTDDPKLSQKAREAIANPEHTIFLSVVSAWEIIIKAQIGKLSLPELPASFIPNRIEYYGFQPLTVQMSHVHSNLAARSAS